MFRTPSSTPAGELIVAGEQLTVLSATLQLRLGTADTMEFLLELALEGVAARFRWGVFGYATPQPRTPAELTQVALCCAVEDDADQLALPLANGSFSDFAPFSAEDAPVQLEVRHTAEGLWRISYLGKFLRVGNAHEPVPASLDVVASWDAS